MPTINSCFNITNQHNCVGADDFRPRILHKFIYIHFVGTSLAAVRYNLPSTIASYYNQTFILPAFQHFLFIQKSKRLQKKSKLRAAPRDLANAAPQHLACGSQLVARHIRAQTRRSLNECALVRLASQAVSSHFPVRLQTLRRGY